MEQIHTKAIVLALTPYNDRYGIAHLYSEQYGRLGVLLPKKKGKYHICFRPLCEIELFGHLRPRRSLVELKEARILTPFHRIQLEGVKHSQGIFLSELLYRLLMHAEPEPELYAFVYHSLEILEELSRGTANFYLCFTYRLLLYLGIAPDLSWEPTQGQWYDLLEVCYTQTPRDIKQAIAPSEVGHLPIFARMTYANLYAYRYSRFERARIIDYLITYCHIHLPPFPRLQSLDMLRKMSSLQGN